MITERELKMAADEEANAGSVVCAEMASSSPEAEKPLQIDVGEVLRSKIPGHYNLVPRFVVSWLKRTMCEDELNEGIRRLTGKRGVEFCEGALDELGVTYSAKGVENIDPSNRRVIITSNHPLGAIDGLALVDCFSRIYGNGLHILVNDILMAVKPLNGIFVPINRYGKLTRDLARLLDEIFLGNNPIILFPAGFPSRLHKDGSIVDNKWNKMFITKCVEYRRDIVPVHFSGQNSKSFYKIARRLDIFKLKKELDMIFLPKEMFKSRGSNYNITIGRPIAHGSVRAGKSANDEAQRVRNIVYSLNTYKMNKDNG